jgi:hypothetical protein
MGMLASALSVRCLRTRNLGCAVTHNATVIRYAAAGQGTWVPVPRSVSWLSLSQVRVKLGRSAVTQEQASD